MTLLGIYFSYQTILLLAATIPAIFLLVKVYRKDRLEKEPLRLLFTLVILGGFSTISALILETIGQGILGSFFAANTVLYTVLMNYLVIGFSEEWSKYIFMKVKTWKSKEFDCQFDGVIYAVFTSLGFALFENIMYVFQYGLSTAMLRAVTSIPGHASFGLFMGIFYGIAKKNQIQGNKVKSKIYRKLAIIVPMIIHGTYDFILSIKNVDISLVFIIFIVILFFISNSLINRYSKNDVYITYEVNDKEY